MNIAIVGSGIAGLASALSLRRAGHAVQVSVFYYIRPSAMVLTCIDIPRSLKHHSLQQETPRGPLLKLGLRSTIFWRNGGLI